MQCPRCNRSLVVVERNDVELDWCPECQGFWLDENEIEIIKYKLGITHDVINPLDVDIIRTDEKVLKCPKCNSFMGKVDINGLIVDKCLKRHGVWFDKFELSEFFNKFSHVSEQNGNSVNFLGEVFRKN